MAGDEVQVRAPGMWGVTVNWKKSVADQREPAPRFNEEELPKDVIVPGHKGYAMVHIVFRVDRIDHATRCVHYDAVMYPRVATKEGLQKLSQRFVAFTAWLSELTNKTLPNLPPEGASIVVMRHLRRYFPPTDTPEQTSVAYDWRAPLYARRLEAEEEHAASVAAARMRALEPAIVVHPPQWPFGMEDWPGIGPFIHKLFSTREVIHATRTISVPPLEKIEIPEVDPWEQASILVDPRRLAEVDRALDSLYSMLVIQQEKAEAAMQQAGFGHVFHKTRVYNQEMPVSPKLWGKAGNTLVLSDASMAVRAVPEPPQAGKGGIKVTERKPQR